MVRQILKGTSEEIRGHDAELIGKHVELLVFSDETANGVIPENPGANGRMYFGMFKGDREVTEEDFKIAEWRGEDLDICSSHVVVNATESGSVPVLW